MNFREQKARILIVDDSEGDALLLSAILSEEHEVSLCTSGRDTLEIVKSLAVDLIILDILMPEMDGYKVCKHLKANPATSTIPVIFITAQLSYEQEIEGFKMGAVDYIRKPVSPTLVKMRVRNYLELKNSRDAALKELQYKIEFLARIGHEIRTPMHVVNGMTDIVLNTKLNTHQRGFLKKISTASKTLIRIIEDILDLTKIEIGKTRLVVTDFRLDDVLIQVSDLMSFLAEKKKLDLIISRPLNVPDNLIGDPTRLSQILINLVSNAIKFTRSGEVIVRVDVAERRSSQVTLRFVIEDTGIGLSTKDFTNIFNQFERGASHLSRKEEGFGLGLHICKHLVEMMGGTIHAASKNNNGSIFSFTAHFEEKYSSSDKFDLPSYLKGRRVLVVASNQTFRKTLCGTLQSFHLQPSGVASSMEALDEISSNRELIPLERYCIIFLDLSLPDLDGVELQRVIRERHPSGNFPKIFLMIYASERHEISERELLCFTDTIIKPVHPIALREIITKACDNSNTTIGVPQEKPEGVLSRIRNLQGKNILILQDAGTKTGLHLDMFRSFGIAVTTVDKGDAMVVAVREDEFDLVLVNVDYSRLGWLESIKILRKDHDLKRLPILTFSSEITFDDRENLFSIGVNDHIDLPMKADGLLHFVNRWLSSDIGDYFEIKNLEFNSHNLAANSVLADGAQASPKFPGSDGRSPDFTLHEIRDSFLHIDRLLFRVLRNNELAKAKKTLSYLKEYAEFCGAEALWKAFGSLEMAVDRGDHGNFQPLIIRIKKRVEPVIENLGKIISNFPHHQNKEEAVRPIDLDEELKPLFGNLIALLVERNVKAVVCFLKIKKLLNSGIYFKELALIEELMEGFDFSEAYTLVLQLCHKMRFLCKSEEVPPGINGKILAVDDDESNLSVLASMLVPDYDVVVAKNGFQALEIAHSQLPDLILLDVGLPDMTGYEVCQKLKNSEMTSDIPVIFVTAMSRDSDEIEGLKVGAVDYITKPFQISSVKNKIKNNILFYLARNKLKEANQILIEEKNIVETVLANMRQTETFDERNLRYLLSPLEKTMGDLILSSFRPDMTQHLLLGDFTGHGLTAAIGGPLVSEVFYSETARGVSMAEIFSKINRILHKALPVGLFMTACCLELDSSRTQLTIWNGGQPEALLFRENRCVRTFPSTHIPRGMIDRPDVAGSKILVEKGDRIIIYSDGIVEEKNDLGEAFGIDRLIKTLEDIGNDQEIQMGVINSINIFKNNITRQSDDITLIELTC